MGDGLWDESGPVRLFLPGPGDPREKSPDSMRIVSTNVNFPLTDTRHYGTNLREVETEDLPFFSDLPKSIEST